MNTPELFGVGEAQLLPIIEAAAKTPRMRITHLSPLADSNNSNKGLVTFGYNTRGGDAGVVSLFVKRCVWHNRPESIHYRYLAARGVPMPRLYGAVRRGTDPEVLFLEPLSAAGFRKDREIEWRALLTLMARFNACSIDADYLPHLYPFGQVGRIDENHWLIGLTAFPTDDKMAAALGRYGVPDRDLPPLISAARALFAQVAAQPMGLLHQDFLPDNVGCAGEQAEMVVFDVHKNALGPRFADVAPYLFVSEWADQTAAFLTHEQAGTSRHESLVQHYLGEYARFGGAVVSPAEFYREIRELFWAHKVAALDSLAASGAENAAGRIRAVLEFLESGSS